QPERRSVQRLRPREGDVDRQERQKKYRDEPAQHLVRQQLQREQAVAERIQQMPEPDHRPPGAVDDAYFAPELLVEAAGRFLDRDGGWLVHATVALLDDLQRIHEIG